MGFMAALLAVAVAVTTPPPATSAPPGTPARLRFEIVATYPHDATSFTEGLQVAEGRVYESAGLAGESRLQVTDLQTGAMIAHDPLGSQYFGEGLALAGERVIQLTWQDRTAFVRNRETLAPIGTFSYTGEGWGLCFDGKELYMSDGSATLTVRNPDSFAELRRIDVTRDGAPLELLNELECAAGKVWANVWQSTEIVRIDPATGAVDAEVDLRPLLTETEWAALDPNDVLNGIAIDETGAMFVTGKRWPKLYELRLVDDAAKT